MKLFDSHTHNHHSHDSHQSYQQQCDAALAAGLFGIAMTDHAEMDPNEWGKFGEEHIPLSVADSRKAKEEYAGRLKVTTGIELGQALLFPQRATEILESYPFDFVLCSWHNPPNEKDYCLLPLICSQIPQLMADYFSALEQSAALCDFDSLAHLTYPIRYIQGEYGIPVDLTPHQKVIDAIFTHLITRDKALELNTSGYRQKLGMPMPHRELLLRYRALGGTKVTLGSDSHKPEHMGGGLQQGIALLQECGFSSYYYYEKRQPIAVSLT